MQQHPPYAGAQQQQWQGCDSSAGYDVRYQNQQYQQQQPGYGQHAQHSQQQLQEDGPAGADGSRGLGTAMLGAGHKMHKVGLVMHHVAHPVQGSKYHTVDKVKRKIKGKVCHMVDKVMP
jgi:hypothetical protein